MLTYERKEFMNTIHKIRDAFKVQMREVKLVAAARARTAVLNIFEDLKRIFVSEYGILAEQFNKVRY